MSNQQLQTTRRPTLPDLANLPPHLAAKFRAMNPDQLDDIFNPKEGQ